MTLEQEMARIKAQDELFALECANMSRLPDETYEQNVERRAKLNMRCEELRRILGDNIR